MEQRSTTRLELTVTGAAAATFAALLASYSAFRPVRDALIFGENPDNLPWVWLGTFIVISVVSPAWSAMQARWTRRTLLPVAYHVFAACAVGFFFVFRAKLEPVLAGRVFYIWSAVFNLFIVSVFWSLLADLLGPGIARRLYGPIAAGGTIGTFVGPYLTRALVGSIGTAGVLLMSAVLLELAVIGLYTVRSLGAQLPRHDPEPEAPPGGGAFTGLVHVAKSRYLATIVGYVLCTACLASFVYLRQARVVREALPAEAARVDYLATINLCVAAITFVLQTVVARLALPRVGPGLVLMVLPIVQLVGISVLVVAPSLTAIAIVATIGPASTHGLTRPARELLFTVISRDDKYRAKHAIDTIGYRLGDVASGWLNNLLLAIGGTVALVYASIPIVAIWLALAVALGIGFRRRLELHKEHA